MNRKIIAHFHLTLSKKNTSMDIWNVNQVVLN